jgi:hypothetical protein
LFSAEKLNELTVGVDGFEKQIEIHDDLSQVLTACHDLHVDFVFPNLELEIHGDKHSDDIARDDHSVAESRRRSSSVFICALSAARTADHVEKNLVDECHEHPPSNDHGAFSFVLCVVFYVSDFVH